MVGLNTHGWSELERAIGEVLGWPLGLRERSPVGGGCINEAWRLVTDRGEFFLKLNDVERGDLFAAEADGLIALAGGGIRVPEVRGHGSAGGRSWLLLEFLPLGGLGGDAAARLGEALAVLHGPAGERFGWRRDNYIGATPQANGEMEDWVSFLRDRRLGPQLTLAEANGAPGGLIDAGEALLAALPAFFADHDPAPALLHGDLWGGNAGALADGTPVLFDPAVYRGDREADIAMTELFGGFGPAFLAAYEAALPLDPGYGLRRDLYNLYHVLNHFNLFGGGYGRQALGYCERLLSAIR